MEVSPATAVLPSDALASSGCDSVTIEYANSKSLTLETGEIGRLANGSIMLKAGDTMVYTNACADYQLLESDFTPLQVAYHERLSAAGRTACASLAPEHASQNPALYSHHANLVQCLIAFSAQNQCTGIGLCHALFFQGVLSVQWWIHQARWAPPRDRDSYLKAGGPPTAALVPQGVA